MNHNWLVKTTAGKFVLREVSDFKKLKDIRFEIKYLNYFHKKNFPYEIPRPLKNKNSKEVIKFKGSYFWIYPFIDGKLVKKFGKKELKEVARLMADYHKILENSKLNNHKGNSAPFNKDEILEELMQYKLKCSEEIKKGRICEIFLKEAADLINILNSLNTDGYLKLKQYPIHRDINPENILFKDNRVVGLIDFDNVSFINEPLVKDIVIFLMYSCRMKKDKTKLDLNLSKFFIREYRKYHNLTKREIELIPYLGAAGSIEDFSYAFWLLQNDPERAKLKWLKQYAAMAKWFFKNKEQIVRILSD